LVFVPRRRGFLVISVAILKAAKNGVTKARLLSSLSLSYEQATRYISFLEAHGFIEKHDSLYRTTAKGFKLIKEFEQSSLIRSILHT